MSISYKKSKTLDPKQIYSLYKSANWINKGDTGKFLVDSYKNSDIVFSAWDGKKLVGVIRALTDKKMDGVIFGLVVRKEYQKKGIGKKLTLKVLDMYPKVRWYLGTTNKNKGFYKKVGFTLDKDPWFKKI